MVHDIAGIYGTSIFQFRKAGVLILSQTGDTDTLFYLRLGTPTLCSISDWGHRHFVLSQTGDTDTLFLDFVHTS